MVSRGKQVGSKDTSSGGGVDSQLLALEIIDSGYLVWWHHCQPEGFRTDSVRRVRGRPGMRKGHQQG